MIMRVVQNKTFDAEREFYESSDVIIKNCTFEGPANGESAFKESRNISVQGCLWRLRYPFWHDEGLEICDTELTDTCRAALWYSGNIKIKDSRLHGIKALRECHDVSIEGCSIVSAEFGWSVNKISMKDSRAEGEYFMMRSSNLCFRGVELQGKYSFQYIENALFENCNFNTKDAFWHAKNVVVKNSTIKGEYLAWYAENITFENCTIIGTQPLCYCRGLRLINCRMEQADLSFEKSEVEATLTAPVISIKNPTSGHISLPSVGEIIQDDPRSRCEIKIMG